MISLLLRHKYFFYFIGSLLLCEVIINPLGEFSIVDDWSYAQALLHFRNTGEVNLGNFPAMTLYTQIMWGYLFTKVLGFSFLVLRFSTLVSVIIGSVFFYKLLVQITGNKTTATLACAILVFNPMVFSLTNSFMTDVNFNTLVIVCVYLMYNYLQTSHIKYYLLFVFFSTALVLLRQYGIIFPFCFVLIAFFMPDKRWRHVLLAIFSLVLVAGILKMYEIYLISKLPEGSTYKFSGNVHLLETKFWTGFYRSFNDRRKEIILHILVYSMPFAILFVRSLLKHVNSLLISFVFLLSVYITYLLFSSHGVTSATVFSSMILGTETFYESFHGARHNVYEYFNSFMFYVKVVSAFLSLFVAFLGLMQLEFKPNNERRWEPSLVFFILILFSYIFMILVTESYFDRYHIPLITISILLFSYFSKSDVPDYKLVWLPLFFWLGISVLGTKDYMELNRQKWEAYHYLRQDLKIPKEKINAGFEITCWNEGEGMGWREFLVLAPFNYLIQFNPEKGFKPYKEYEFQRYFPYKKDKIYIFVRDSIK